MTPLEQFVAEHLGPVDVLSRPPTIGASRVMHVRDASGRRWFAKRLVKERPYAAEVAGYRLWAGTPGIPTPRAVCAELLHDLHDATPPQTWLNTWRDLVVVDTDQRLAHLVRRGVTVDQGAGRAGAGGRLRRPLGCADNGLVRPKNGCTG